MHTSLEKMDRQIDQAMGVPLRLGVIIAASVVFGGGVLYLSRHAIPATDYRVFTGEPAEYRMISGILQAAKEFSGRGLIQLGLLILIATPIARVVFSVLAFCYERDWKYLAFTLVVLGLLLFSLFGHG